MAEDSKDLFERALAGDRAAQDELIEQCYNTMIGVLCKRGLFDLVPKKRNSQDSEDLKKPEELIHQDPAHEVFAKILPHLGQLKTKIRPVFLKFFATAADRWAIDELRRRGRWKFAKPNPDDEGQDLVLDLPDEHHEANPAEASLSREEDTLKQAKLERLKGCRDELVPEYQAIYDFLFKGETLTKIAKEIKKSVTFVSNRRNDIFAQLRKCLERQH